MNKTFNQRDFVDKRTTAQQFITLGRVVAPIATVVAIISIAGLLALPVLIPLWIFCYKKDKADIETSDKNARKILSDINFDSKYEFSKNNVVISVDPESKIITFWRKVSAFQPGIFSFDEIKEVSWEKDGDLITTSLHSAGPISVPHTTTKKGNTYVTITTNRISQPNFIFGIKSPSEAKDLTQRLSIAMGWVD